MDYPKFILYQSRRKNSLVYKGLHNSCLWTTDSNSKQFHTNLFSPLFAISFDGYFYVTPTKEGDIVFGVDPISVDVMLSIVQQNV